MPIENGSFEEHGARLGEPRAWRLRAVVRSTELASFGDPPVGRETFSWLELRRLLSPGDVVRAMFGAAPVEAFASWAIGAAQVLDDVATEPAVFDAAMAERFAPGWSNPSLADTWGGISSVPADWGATQHETFQPGWPGTTPRYLAWSEITEDNAQFDGETAEAFRFTWPPI